MIGGEKRDVLATHSIIQFNETYRLNIDMMREKRYVVVTCSLIQFNENSPTKA